MSAIKPTPLIGAVAYATKLAGGDVARLEIVDDRTVIVWNSVVQALDPPTAWVIGPDGQWHKKR